MKERMRKRTNSARQTALPPQQMRHVFPKHAEGTRPAGCSIVNSHAISKECGQFQEEGNSRTRSIQEARARAQGRPHSRVQHLTGYWSLQISRGAAPESHTALELLSSQALKPLCTENQHASPAAVGFMSPFHGEVPNQWVLKYPPGFQDQELLLTEYLQRLRDRS